MSDKLDSVAQTSQRIRVSGMVLMNHAVKFVDHLGAELILPLPLSVKVNRLAGPDNKFQDIVLVQADKPQEACPMDDFPAYLEHGYYMD